eukprot:NODE_425_length_7669_cov_0.863937.p2 type:complete len:539 gc:universal NODE_425_length_7669_cov_0.863937:957-2573(+)
MFHDKKKINVINMDQEFDQYMKMDWVKYGTRLKLKQFHELLHHLPRTSSISITSATQLQRELFTHKGAGTLIRRGFKIQKHDIDSVNIDLLRHQLKDHYLFKDVSLTLFLGSLHDCDIYCDEAYECIVIVKRMDYPFIVLFHAHKSALLNDVHEMIFENIMKDYEKFMWVIHHENVEKLWHFKKATGTLKSQDEIILWKGNNLEKVQSQYDSYRKVFQRDVGKRFYSTLKYSTKRRYSQKISNVGLIGARGYTGQELINIIARHPNLKLECVSSRELKGKKVENTDVTYSLIDPKDIKTFKVDAWILALPNLLSTNYVKEIETPVVDLSADHRFTDDWVYGLPELHRNKIKKQAKISNPGCYATGMQLALAPILTRIHPNPHIFGVSGYSGAGTTKSKYNDIDFLDKNIVPYKLQQHIHEKEVSRHLMPIQFTPHVSYHFRGIVLTIHVHLHGKSSKEQLIKAYKDFYINEPLVRVIEEIPNLKDIKNQHHVEIGGFSVHDDRAVIVCTIDNLLKGAATQCIQNLNLALEYPEFAGII